MKARELAAEINALKLGFSTDKSALNSALYRSGTSDLQKNESWEWELKPAAASGIPRERTVKQAKSAQPARTSPAPAPFGAGANRGQAAAPAPPRQTQAAGYDFPPDPEQLAVIREPVGARLIVDAGPGTGKTAVACRRIARLIDEEDVNPANILIISFTRTAVAEIRNRIAHYVNRTRASQVQISTIDSTAWRLEVVHGDSSTEARSFDETIEAALDLLRSRFASLMDFVEALEHVVVDEAQDVTGIRSDFVLELLRTLPVHCGVTIFADPLQSIYGFTEENEGGSATIDGAEAAEPPVERLKKALPRFRQVHLRRAHRFSPAIAPVLEQSRVIVGNGEIEGANKHRLLEQSIRGGADELPHEYKKIAALVRNDPHALLLFRYRREVVQASSFLLSEGIPHRVRMPGLPECIQPWIARIFGDYTEATIDRKAFGDRFAVRCEPRLPHEREEEAAWEILRRLAPGDRGLVKVPRLRSVLAKARPPIDACDLDSGALGPTVGTIHASKGREAAAVYLFVPSLDTKGDLEEECRVLYVAATRAREKLLATSAFRADGERLEESGRCFALLGPKHADGARIEVGLSHDLHEAMTVSTRIHQHSEDAREVQECLWTNRMTLAPLAAKRTQRGTEFRLTHKEGVQENLLGALSPRVFRDIETLCILRDKRGLPSWGLDFLFLVGARTHAVEADRSQELTHLHDPYRSTGIFLVPHIRGYCRFFINNVGKSK